jgi:sugar lactone lactonase YvrE
MNYLVVFLVFLLLFLRENAFPDTSTFSARIDFGRKEVAYSVQETADHGFIVTGKADDLPFIMKTDAAGAVEWAKTLGDDKISEPGDGGAQIITATDGEYVVVGTQIKMTLVVKIDQQGNIVWQSLLDGKDGRGITQAADGGFLLVGTKPPPPWERDPSCEGHYCGSPASMGIPYHSDYYLAKIDLHGDLVWEKAIGENSHGDSPQVLIPTSSGEFAVAGYQETEFESAVVLFSVDQEGNRLWKWRRFLQYYSDDLDLSYPEIYDVIETADGQFMMVGTGDSDFSREHGADWDLLISQVTPSTEEHRVLRLPGNQVGYAICKGIDSGYIVTGGDLSYEGEQSIFLAKLSASVETLWTKIHRDMGVGRDIEPTADGGYVIAGELEGDIHLLKIDQNGSLGISSTQEYFVDPTVVRHGPLGIVDLPEDRVLEDDVFFLNPNHVFTIAGEGNTDGLPAKEVPLGSAESLFVDPDGNIYTAVSSRHSVFRVDAHSGLISTVAGTGDNGFSGDGGPATEASLSYPADIFFDNDGNLLITESQNHRIRKVDGRSGIISTIVGTGRYGNKGDGGPAIEAEIAIPYGLFVDPQNNIFFGERWNRVSRVDGQTGIINTIAGNGSKENDGVLAIEAKLYFPNDVFGDMDGNLLIAEKDRHKIRKIDGETGNISTVAGNGGVGNWGDGRPAAQAQIGNPKEIFVDHNGHIFIVTNDRIRKVDGETGIVTTVVGGGEKTGDGIPALEAKFRDPQSVSVDRASNIFIAADMHVYKVDAATDLLHVVVGNGESRFAGDGYWANKALLNRPVGLVVDRAGNLFILDSENDRVRKMDARTKIITTVAGGGIYGDYGDGGPAIHASLGDPQGICLDQRGNLYISQRERGDNRGHKIRMVDALSGIISTVAGSGSKGFSGGGGAATEAQLNDPGYIAVDAQGNLYIDDRGNHRIRKVDALTQTITTVVGGGTSYEEGLPATEVFIAPRGLCLDRVGNLFISENHCIRRVDAVTQIITTIAGDGNADFYGDGGLATEARLNSPSTIFIDEEGNLFISDIGNSRIRKVGAESGIITTIVGNGHTGFTGEGGLVSKVHLNGFWGITVDAAGNLYFTETGNHRIRKTFILETPTLLPTASTAANSTPTLDWYDALGAKRYVLEVSANSSFSDPAVYGNLVKSEFTLPGTLGKDAFFWRIKSVSAAGIESSYSATAVDSFGIGLDQATSIANEFTPDQYALAPNFPNPFNPQTQIAYQLPEPSEVSLVIFDILGQKVCTLVEEEQIPGFYHITWDGKSHQGQIVSSGVYFYKFKSKGLVQTRRMLLLR